MPPQLGQLFVGILPPLSQRPAGVGKGLFCLGDQLKKFTVFGEDVANDDGVGTVE